MKVTNDVECVENMIRQRVCSIKQDLDEFQENSVKELNAIKNIIIK